MQTGMNKHTLPHSSPCADTPLTPSSSTGDVPPQCIPGPQQWATRGEKTSRNYSNNADKSVKRSDWLRIWRWSKQVRACVHVCSTAGRKHRQLLFATGFKQLLSRLRLAMLTFDGGAKLLFANWSHDEVKKKTRVKLPEKCANYSVTTELNQTNISGSQPAVF